MLLLLAAVTQLAILGSSGMSSRNLSSSNLNFSVLTLSMSPRYFGYELYNRGPNTVIAFLLLLLELYAPGEPWCIRRSLSFTWVFLLGPVFFRTSLPPSGKLLPGEGWDTDTLCGWGKL